MTAGDVDSALAVDVGADGYTIPVGAACAIVIAPGKPPYTGRALPPYTGTAAGNVITYVTVAATDVPNGGWWTIWATVTGSGYAYTSPPGSFWVDYAPIST